MDSAFERVTAALTNWGSVQRGPNWTCPAHEDQKASLTVTRKADRVLLNCKAYCPTESIIGILGLNMHDLFDEQKELREKRLIARYLYKDEQGTVLFSKERYEPKDFLVWHPNGNGWAPSLGGARPVLYRLPELNEAVAKGQTVYVVEGEKDADAMAKAGHVATCNYEGGGSWKAGYAQYFTGADVVVIADRDEAGYKHAKDIKSSLENVARSVCVLQSAVNKPKADVSDHLAEGYRVEDLVPIGGAFKPVNLTGLVARGVTPPEMLLDGMLYAGGLHGIAGAPDSGKTTVSLYWAVQLLAQGKRVAFFDEEGGREIVAEKLIALGAQSSQMNLLTYVPFPGKMWDDSDIEALMEFLGEVRPAMVLWDSSAAFLARAGLDENSAPAVTMWWAKVLTPLARDLRAAVVVIDHDTKASEQSRYARGSGAKLAASDVQYKVEIKKPFTRSDSGLLRLTVSKDRRGYLHRTWLVHMEATGVGLRPDFVHESETAYTDSWSPAKRKVWGVLSREFQTNEEIRELIKKYHPGQEMARETVSRALNELLHEQFVAKAGDAWRRCRDL